MPDPTSPARRPVLAGRGLEQRYRIGKREVEVLRGIDLELAEGEAVFLTGSSGAGKTTLMYCLAGLERPAGGEVTIAGDSLYCLSSRRQSALRNERMGYIFQNYYLLPELTALENVLAPARLGRRDGRERALSLFERLGLSQRVDHLPGELSGGEQQRVAIARALVNRPQVVFADEPTGNLDSQTGEEVIQLLLELVREENYSLLLVTHDRTLATRGDRRLHLIDGRLGEPS